MTPEIKTRQLVQITRSRPAFPDNLSLFKPKSPEPLNQIAIKDPFDDFDDILNSAVVVKQSETIVDISEEKKFLGLKSDDIKVRNIRRSTILNADTSSDGVIYSFRQLQEYKQNNRAEFDRAKESIIMQARMAQDMDGCGGRNETGLGNEIGLFGGGSNITSLADRRMDKILGTKDDHKHGANEKGHCKHGKHSNECDDLSCREAA